MGNGYDENTEKHQTTVRQLKGEVASLSQETALGYSLLARNSKICTAKQDNVPCIVMN
jgi:hypothetical protein